MAFIKLLQAYQVEVKSECGPHSTKWTVTKRYNDFSDVRESVSNYYIANFDYI
jgi:hypothetical protein